ncbi:S8 family serine peptidase [Microcoleus sp. D3_18a_C4]|uniref:S8 family serine peptidase n=1 Tax=Microcoleus sp. D3_18a_C4 TaxID=3055332 RepID=UPI002FD25D33
MGWLNFGGKKRKEAQDFGNSSKTKSRKRPKSFRLETIVTPSVGVGGWLHEFDYLHQLLGSLSLSDLDLPNFLADSGVCPIDPFGAPTNNLPPLIDFDPLGLYHDGIATQTPYNPGGAFETLPIALIPVDPHSPNPNNPNAIRQLLNFPLASQPLLGSIDTGVSADSPYLNYANIKKGRDYVGGDDNPLLNPGEGSEHGTFMLGIIDAINKTAPKWVGRAIDSGRWADSLVEFVDAAKASGQKNAIANLSLDLTQKNADGSVTTRYELTPAERKALEYARQNGVLLVTAAGNDGGVMSVLGQASQEFNNILTVGAADGKNRAAYSSYGRGLDILAEGGTPENPEWSTVGEGVGTMAGTSVATAKVTGAASLVWAANPDLSYRQVIEILEKTAKDLGAPGWDDETGFGLLNVLAAVEKAKQTTPEVYNPEDFLNLTTWSKEGQVTPEERAVQVHQVQNPSGRRYYYGWLNNSNRMDRFDFTVTSKKLVQLSLKDLFDNEFREAQVSLWDDYGNRIAVNQPDFNSSYRSVTLYPGKYHLQVDKGSRYEIDPYKLILNFNEDNNTSVVDDRIWLPRPTPVFTNPGGPQVTVPVEPQPVDWQKIAEEQAKADLLKKQQAEAAAKAAAEATAKAAAEASAKAAAEAAQRRRLEAEENARQAITLAYIQNKSWLGNPLNGVQIDWNTLLNSRVAAIQYFDGGYVVWNGIHAVAYKTGSGNSSATNVTPVEVRLHDLGMQYGRQEYGQYVGFSKRQDYYKFTLENLGDSYPHELLFALRSNGVDIPLTDATIEILDDQMKRVPLSQVWQPNGQPGLSHLNGTTYYVRVKPAKDNLNYGLTLNLDSAQENLGTARPLGAIKGRRQFRDFVGNKGDGLGDYYSFSVEHPSLLHFSLSELEAGADANVELLDTNGNVVSLDSLSGKVGAKKLQPGSYYLRVIPANNTNTNYTLTMQMAEELGTYTGRHEYKDRIIAGKNREAYYRLNIDAPAEELHLSLKNLSADANVELLRDNGGGIVNSTLIFPVDGSNQSGTEAEYKGYANVQPGNYLVRVYLPNSSTQAAKYDLVMNLDQAGEDWSQTRDLGMLTDIAPLSDYQLSDFVGADKGDSSDVYKFQVGDYGLVHLALKPPAGDGEANMLAANMRLQDESGKDVIFLNANKNSGENYAAAHLQPGKSYYLTVIPTPGMMTNYNLVINPVSEETINEFKVSGDLYKVFAKYRESLGNPTSAVTNQSNGVNYQAFQNALIVSSSYGTYPVWWGIKDAYLNKYGSLSGKLGSPKGMEYDWNGGKRQDFAGGYITWKNGTTNAYKPDGSPLYPPPVSPNMAKTGSIVKALQIAIFGQESGYNYAAVNSDSGALGIAQVMPENIPSWSREALGYPITANQFLNSPDLQLKIVAYKLNQYYQQAIAASGGNVDIAVRRVASDWYSGNPNLYNNTSPQYTNGVQYPSIANYTLSVLGKFKQAYDGGSRGPINTEDNLPDKMPLPLRIESDFLTLAPAPLGVIKIIPALGGNLLLSFDKFTFKAKLKIENQGNIQLAAENIQKAERAGRGLEFEKMYSSVSAGGAGIEIHSDKITGVFTVTDTSGALIEFKLPTEITSPTSGKFSVTLETPLSYSDDAISIEGTPYYEIEGRYAGIPNTIYKPVPAQEPILAPQTTEDLPYWMILAGVIMVRGVMVVGQLLGRVALGQIQAYATLMGIAIYIAEQPIYIDEHQQKSDPDQIA